MMCVLCMTEPALEGDDIGADCAKELAAVEAEVRLRLARSEP